MIVHGRQRNVQVSCDTSNRFTVSDAGYYPRSASGGDEQARLELRDDLESEKDES